MALLELNDLHKTYRSGSVTTPALRGVSMNVTAGEFTAVVGPSGSGKTTLMNLIGGLDAPDTGHLIFDEHEMSGLGQRELATVRLWKIGFVFQAYNLIPVLSARENVEYVMLLQGLSVAERRERALAALADLGIEDLAEKRPNQMSGGQQQRVAVARAIASRPRLVLADEPTANLDSATSCRLLDLMRELNEKSGITFLFSTHDPLVVERARRVVTIRDGVIAHDEARV